MERMVDGSRREREEKVADARWVEADNGDAFNGVSG